jgi:hypothetical protein
MTLCLFFFIFQPPAKTKMSHPKNVGIKAIEIYIPGQVNAVDDARHFISILD